MKTSSFESYKADGALCSSRVEVGEVTCSLSGTRWFSMFCWHGINRPSSVRSHGSQEATSHARACLALTDALRRSHTDTTAENSVPCTRSTFIYSFAKLGFGMKTLLRWTLPHLCGFPMSLSTVTRQCVSSCRPTTCCQSSEHTKHRMLGKRTDCCGSPLLPAVTGAPFDLIWSVCVCVTNRLNNV